jgi:hypothetical protein
MQIFSGNVTRYYPVQVRYSGTGNAVANKSVNITNNLGVLVFNSTTDSNGWLTANLTFNTTNFGNGNFIIEVNPSQNISLSTYTPIIFDINDSEFPKWGNNETEPNSTTVYNPSQSYQFLVDWSDNNALSSVWFEADFSGSLANHSASGSTGNTYYYDYNGLAAGTYQWRSYANDSSGNLNKSDIFTYTVNNASGQVSLLLNSASDNLTLSYGNSINASASTQHGNITLYRDGSDVTAAENHFYALLGVGYYNYTAVSTGNQNYTQASITKFVNITPVSSGNNNNNNGGGGSGGGGLPQTNTTNNTKPAAKIENPESCTEDWICSDWSSCTGEMKTRNCIDLNDCKTDNRPSESQSCNLLAPNLDKINVGKLLMYILIPIFVILIVSLILFMKRENKIEILIKRAKRAIRKKKLEMAKRIYRRLHEIYMNLHESDKKKYHYKIQEIYHKIKNLEKTLKK